MSLFSFISALVPTLLVQQWDRVKASPLGYRLAAGVFWSLVGALISRVLGLIAIILVARKLGSVGFGELGIIQSTVGMLGTFVGFGLGLTATKHVAEFRTGAPVRAGRIIALSVITAVIIGGSMAIVLFFGAPWLATHTLAAPHLSGLLRVAALLLFLGAVNGAQTGALSGFESFRTIAWVNFLAGISAFPLVIGGVYIDGINGAIWGLTGSMAVNWVLNHLALRKEMRKVSVSADYEQCFTEWRVLVAFSLPASMTSALVVPTMWACNALLVNQENGYPEMGIFNAAQQWRMPLLFVGSLLGQTMMPIVSERLSHGTSREVLKLLKISLLVSLCVCLPVCLAVIGFGKHIMMWYGSQFAGGWPVLALLQLAAFLQVIQSPAITALQATGSVWAHFFINCVWCIVLLVACLLLVEKGAIGLSFAHVLAFVIYWPLLAVTSRRILKRAIH
jgi:O-antigen/teichoic acid export membrane protein